MDPGTVNWKKSIEERVELFKKFYQQDNDRILLGFFCGSEYPVHRYPSGRSVPEGIALRLHGETPVRLTLRGGEFPIVPGRKYLITSEKTATLQADAAGVLTVPLVLRGETRVRISRLPQ